MTMTDNVKLAINALRPFALDLRPEVPGNTMIDTLAWSADQHRAAAAALAALEQSGEPVADDPLRGALGGSFCITESKGHPEPTNRSYRMIFSFPTMEAMHAAHAAYVTGEPPLPTLHRLGQEFDAGERAGDLIGLPPNADEQLSKLLDLIETADEHGNECAIVEQAATVRATLSGAKLGERGHA